MKITIDTKEDSPADIRKVIALLSKMIEGGEEHHSNIFEDSSPSVREESGGSAGMNAFANMFGGGSSSAEKDDTPVLGESLVKKESEENDEDVPEIMEY